MAGGWWVICSSNFELPLDDIVLLGHPLFSSVLREKNKVQSNPHRSYLHFWGKHVLKPIYGFV